ncbi:type II toxin-antitoxin system RelE/ParE family toxin [Morganella morganii]|uniref:type II toxin-antitoxin system RelE/ParE family toxin n=1 Tax=Morganella morganii TaxID=582 RepID=UPI0015F748DC|nr:killer suppression protein HigA [Morganella morganii]MBA5856009.1 killer suppression protein HigA [Morganella morganii]
MDILFENSKIQKICEQKKEAEKKLGSICARKLRTRLSDLESASRVTDLVAGSPHPLKGDRAGQFALSLHGGYRLVFSPSNDPCPTTPDGAIDWDKVTIVCIEYIGDYHD